MKKGLIVKSPWIEKILEGLKTWEIRGCNTKNRGKIYLIKSGTGHIYGEVELTNVVPVKREDFNKYMDKYCVSDISIVNYENIYAWILENPVIYETPVPYQHKRGAIIWVNLP